MLSLRAYRAYTKGALETWGEGEGKQGEKRGSGSEGSKQGGRRKEGEREVMRWVVE